MGDPRGPTRGAIAAMGLALAWLIVATPTVVKADASANANASAEYVKKKAAAGRDAASQIRLAAWCETQNLAEERDLHLARALVVEPDNAAARGMLGMIKRQGQWIAARSVPGQVLADPKLKGLLDEYAKKRDAAQRTAQDQSQLASWCDKSGLTDEARTHWMNVVMLDPSRGSAWKRLGYKNVKGLWVSPEQLDRAKADAQANKAADERWGPLLASWKAMMGRADQRAEGERRLSEVRDPRAVPAVWRTFVLGGNEASQELAVRMLGQLDGRKASTALATLALFSDSGRAQREAAELLRQRDAREFVPLLIGMLRKPLKAQASAVRGPGSVGVLAVEGERRNFVRLYDTPLPFVYIAPAGTIMAVDEFGLPMAIEVGDTRRRIASDVRVSRVGADPGNWRLSQGPAPLGSPRPSPMIPSDQLQRFNAIDPRLLTALGASNALTFPESSSFERNDIPSVGRFQVERFEQFELGRSFTTIKTGQIALERAASAMSAQAKLESDLAEVDAMNQRLKVANDRVALLLKESLGVDRGSDREGWTKWWIEEELGYVYKAPPEAPKPTVVERVDPPLIPTPPASRTDTVVYGRQESITTVQTNLRGSCFAKGTLICTLMGPRPIETLRQGDLALTMDVQTGELEYRPILKPIHNQPRAVLRIKFDGQSETIGATHLHRFWVVGQGWVKARDLKPGDTVRSLGNTLKVEFLSLDAVQPIFNLVMEKNSNYFVGQAQALVHDNTIPRVETALFDASDSTRK